MSMPCITYYSRLVFFSTDLYQNVSGSVPESTYKKISMSDQAIRKFTKISFERYRKARTTKKQCRTRQYGKFTKMPFGRYRKAYTKKKINVGQAIRNVCRNVIGAVWKAHTKKSMSDKTIRNV